MLFLTILTNTERNCLSIFYNMESVYIYGAGNMGQSVTNMAKKKNRAILGIIDKNAELSNTELCGVRVFSPRDISTAEKKQVKIVVSISAVPYVKMRRILGELGFERIQSASEFLNEIGYDSLVNVWELDDNELQKCLDISKHFFFDEMSFAHYKAALGWFYDRDEKIEAADQEDWDREKYFPHFIRELIEPTDSMVDSAILCGEYAQRFLGLATEGTVTAFDLFPSSLSVGEKEVLLEKTSNLTIIENELGSCRESVKVHRVGIMEPFTEDREWIVHTVALDDRSKLIKCDYFRIYSMSPIISIVNGAKHTIKEYRPIMAINIGHYKDDFLSSIGLLKSICDSYRFYFRMHSFQGNDCIIYAVPLERIKR